MQARVGVMIGNATMAMTDSFEQGGLPFFLWMAEPFERDMVGLLDATAFQWLAETRNCDVEVVVQIAWLIAARLDRFCSLANNVFF
jgi:hypothetical protein